MKNKQGDMTVERAKVALKNLLVGMGPFRRDLQELQWASREALISKLDEAVPAAEELTAALKIIRDELSVSEGVGQ